MTTPQIVIINAPSNWDVLVSPGDRAVECKCSRCYNRTFFMGVGFYAAADKNNLLCGQCCGEVFIERLKEAGCSFEQEESKK